MHEEVRRALEDLPTDASVDERVRVAAEAHLRSLLLRSDYTSAHIRCFPSAPPAIRGDLSAKRADYERLWAELLADGHPVDEEEARLRRLALLGALNWSLEWWRPERDDPADLGAAVIRSWLFVPGGRSSMLAKIDALPGDAVILDLEDAVPPDGKDDARAAVAGRLPGADRLWVRINPEGTPAHAEDVAMLRAMRHGRVVLPKATPEAVRRAADLLGPDARILAIATETPTAVLALGGYGACARWLHGLAWGGEDLSAALGARANRTPGGAYTSPYRLARDLTLIAAAAAGVPAIDAVFTRHADLDGLKAEAEEAARDGFAGKLAIHPAQVGPIEAAFEPTADALAHARRVVAAFEAAPEAGAVSLDGEMIDRPHLLAARRLLG